MKKALYIIFGLDIVVFIGVYLYGFLFEYSGANYNSDVTRQLQFILFLINLPLTIVGLILLFFFLKNKFFLASKPKKYWLRGGILFLILVPLIVSLVLAILNHDIYAVPFYFIIFLLILPGYFGYIECGMGGSLCHSNVPDWFYPVAYLSIIIVLFCVGAILGWIYGKIKNRNTTIVS